MKKSVFFGIVCLLMTSVIANGFANANGLTTKGEPASENKRLKKNTRKTESLRLFHVTRVKGSSNKYLVHIAKMPDTKVQVSIIDSEGRTLYYNIRKANKDYLKLVVVEDDEPVTFNIKDDAGFSKSYTFNQ